MSKFHEPWSVVDDFDIVDAYDSEVASEYSGFESKVYVARTVACVNALEGVENPEAVKDLLDTVRKWQQSDGEDVVMSLALEFASVAIQFTEGADDNV